MAKFGMCDVRPGHGRGVQGDGIAFNALWPRTGIATAAIRRPGRRRGPCAHAARPNHGRRRPRDLREAAREFTGNFLIDDTFLYAEGVRDFDQYRVDPTAVCAGLLRPGDSKPPVSLARIAGLRVPSPRLLRGEMLWGGRRE